MQGRSSHKNSPYKLVIKISRNYFKVFMGKLRHQTSLRWLNGKMPDEFCPFESLRGVSHIYVSLDHGNRLQWHRRCPEKYKSEPLSPHQMIDRIKKKVGPKLKNKGVCDVCGNGPTDRDQDGLTLYKGRYLCGACLLFGYEQKTEIEPQTLRTNPDWYSIMG